MLAPGIALFTFGYALLWTGVQRFRGKDTTLIEALGYTGGSTTTLGADGTKTTAAPTTTPESAPGTAANPQTLPGKLPAGIAAPKGN